MKKFIMSFLLLAAAVLFLSIYNEGSRQAETDLAGTTEPAKFYTYSYSTKFVTKIKIHSQQSNIHFYTDSKSKEIIVKAKGARLKGSVSEQELFLETDKESTGQIDVYLPERIYSIAIEAVSAEVEFIDAVKGTLQIHAEFLELMLNGFCGKLTAEARQGQVIIQNGNLQQASSVKLTEKGNIDLAAKLSGLDAPYYFSTGSGYVRIAQHKLIEKTAFDVYALQVIGAYTQVPKDFDQKKEYIRVVIQSGNGIASFQ